MASVVLDYLRRQLAVPEYAPGTGEYVHDYVESGMPVDAPVIDRDITVGERSTIAYHHDGPVRVVTSTGRSIPFIIELMPDRSILRVRVTSNVVDQNVFNLFSSDDMIDLARSVWREIANEYGLLLDGRVINRTSPVFANSTVGVYMKPSHFLMSARINGNVTSTRHAQPIVRIGGDPYVLWSSEENNEDGSDRWQEYDEEIVFDDDAVTITYLMLPSNYYSADGSISLGATPIARQGRAHAMADREGRCRILSLLLAPMFVWVGNTLKPHKVIRYVVENRTNVRSQEVDYNSAHAMRGFADVCSTPLAGKVLHALTQHEKYNTLQMLNSNQTNDLQYLDAAAGHLECTIVCYMDDEEKLPHITGINRNRVIFIGRRIQDGRVHMYAIHDPIHEIGFRHAPAMSSKSYKNNYVFPCVRGTCKAGQVRKERQAGHDQCVNCTPDAVPATAALLVRWRRGAIFEHAFITQSHPDAAKTLRDTFHSLEHHHDIDDVPLDECFIFSITAHETQRGRFFSKRLPSCILQQQRDHMIRRLLSTGIDFTAQRDDWFLIFYKLFINDDHECALSYTNRFVAQRKFNMIKRKNKDGGEEEVKEVEGEATHECAQCGEHVVIPTYLQHKKVLRIPFDQHDHQCIVRASRIESFTKATKRERRTIVFYDFETGFQHDASNTHQPLIVHAQRVTIENYHEADAFVGADEDVLAHMQRCEESGVTFVGRNCHIELLRWMIERNEDICALAYNGSSFDGQYMLRAAFELKKMDNLSDMERRFTASEIQAPVVAGDGGMSRFIKWSYAGEGTYTIQLLDPMLLFGGGTPLNGYAKAMGCNHIVKKIDVVGVDRITQQTLDDPVERERFISYCKRDVSVMRGGFFRYCRYMIQCVEQLFDGTERAGVHDRVDILAYPTAAAIAYDLFVASCEHVIRTPMTFNNSAILRANKKLCDCMASTYNPDFEYHTMEGFLGPLSTCVVERQPFRTIVHVAASTRALKMLAYWMWRNRDLVSTNDPFRRALSNAGLQSDYCGEEYYVWLRFSDFRQRLAVLLSDNDEYTVHFYDEHNASVLNVRDAYFGGRTESFAMRYQCKQDEQLAMVDVASSYPSSYTFKRIPFGHSRWVHGSFFNVAELSLRLIANDPTAVGVYRLEMNFPERPDATTWFPVIGIRRNGLLVFPASLEPTDDTVLTLTSVDIASALRHGYTIKSIHDAVVIEADQTTDRFSTRFTKVFYTIKETPGVEAGLKQCVKLCLNSSYGKLALRPTTKARAFTSTPESACAAITRAYADENIDLNSLHTTSFDGIDATLRTWHLNDSYECTGTNVIAGSFITAHSRELLVEGAYEIAGNDPTGSCMNRILYMDTDSILYSQPTQMPSLISIGAPPGATGPLAKLGCFTNDLKDGVHPTELLCVAPKSYIITQQGSVVKMRAKGLSLVRKGTSHRETEQEATADGFWRAGGGELISSQDFANTVRDHITQFARDVCSQVYTPNLDDPPFQIGLESLQFSGVMKKNIGYQKKKYAPTFGKRRVFVHGEDHVQLIPFGALQDNIDVESEDVDFRNRVALY